MSDFNESGTILYFAEGQVPLNKCDELLSMNDDRKVVGKNRAKVVSKYFIPGENKVIMIFEAENLTQLLHALYRMPGIDWQVKPVASLDDIGKVGGDLRKDCLAGVDVEKRAKDA